MTHPGESIMEAAILVAIGPDDGDGGATFGEIEAVTWTPKGDDLRAALECLMRAGLIEPSKRGWQLTGPGHAALQRAEEVLDDA